MNRYRETDVLVREDCLAKGSAFGLGISTMANDKTKANKTVVAKIGRTAPRSIGSETVISDLLGYEMGIVERAF
jgi:hypothetical protein